MSSSEGEVILLVIIIGLIFFFLSCLYDLYAIPKEIKCIKENKSGCKYDSIEDAEKSLLISKVTVGIGSLLIAAAAINYWMDKNNQKKY